MAELQLVKGKYTMAQLVKFEERQAIRKRVASVLHVLKEEVDACAEAMGDAVQFEASPAAIAELKEKATGLHAVAHLLGVLEPTFEDPEYAVKARPFSSNTIEWLNALVRKKKKKRPTG